MSEPLKISTSKYTSQGKVDVDGKVWSVTLPGVGSELRLSQAFRNSKLYGARISNIDKKIDAGKVTEEELDKYEEFSKLYEQTERTILEIFTNIFRDDTEDNSEVKNWVQNTPTVIIQMAFESIKDQANGTPEAEKEAA